jgi:hypothetical protein
MLADVQQKHDFTFPELEHFEVIYMLTETSAGTLGHPNAPSHPLSMHSSLNGESFFSSRRSRGSRLAAPMRPGQPRDLGDGKTRGGADQRTSLILPLLERLQTPENTPNDGCAYGPSHRVVLCPSPAFESKRNGAPEKHPKPDVALPNVIPSNRHRAGLIIGAPARSALRRGQSRPFAGKRSS